MHEDIVHGGKVSVVGSGPILVYRWHAGAIIKAVEERSEVSQRIVRIGAERAYIHASVNT